MMQTIGYAAFSAGDVLAPLTFERRALRPDDVAIEILYCGICHTDLHMVRDDWSATKYPIVPGHEIVGRVIETGAEVTRFKAGDHAGVGTMVDSCRSCDQCDRGREQFCRKGSTGTYNAADPVDGTTTKGGYSKHIVVPERFALRIAPELDLSRTAPLLCAGITTWSPLRAWNVGPGTRVGVIGLGGLGHMAVKLAAALGAEVTILSRSADKAADARALGAQRFLLSTDGEAMVAAQSSLDLIIDTIPVEHDVAPYMPLLDVEGTLVLVGLVGKADTLDTRWLLKNRRRIAASPIGGTVETQEMLDFCASKNVLPDVEMVSIDELGQAFARMDRSDVRYRFVIDMSSLQG